MVVVFETHAESADNASGLASGWFDVPLSPRGEAQARELGARRRADRFEAVYCSDLERSWRTAQLAFGDRDLRIERDRRLRECDYGELTRVSASQIERQRTKYTRARFPRGESYTDVVARVRAWLTEALARHAGGTIVVIGHRAQYYAFEHLVRQLPLEDVIAAPWAWQPGWTYRLPDGVRRVDPCAAN